MQWLPAVLELMDSKDFKQVLVPRNPTRSPRAGFIGIAQWVYLNFPQRIERYGFLCGTLAPVRCRKQPKNCAPQPHRGGTPPDSGWTDNEWARVQDTMIIRAAVIVTVALIRFWDRTIPRKLLALRLGPCQLPSVSPMGTVHCPPARSNTIHRLLDHAKAIGQAKAHITRGFCWDLLTGAINVKVWLLLAAMTACLLSNSGIEPCGA